MFKGNEAENPMYRLFHKIAGVLSSNSTPNRCIEPEEEEIVEIENGLLSQLQELDEGLVVEILSRLPVKTLLQLKSVCRRWNNIISNCPLLASLQLRNFSSENSPPLIYELPCYDENGGSATVMQLHPDGDASQIRYLEPPSRIVTDLLPLEVAIPSGFEFSIPPNKTWTVNMRIISGPCNGIFLLGDPYGACLRFSLWNPAIGSLKEVPLPVSVNSDMVVASRSYGFGFDRVGNDFKVVLILHSSVRHKTRIFCGGVSSLEESPSKVLVYTLGTDSWRELGVLRHEIEMVTFCEWYRYLNNKGLFFWLCVSPVAALAFDMGTDVFRVINDPVKGLNDSSDDIFRVINDPVNGRLYDDIFTKQLVIYKEDSLALFVKQGRHGDWRSTYDMWLLDEERWIWVKNLTIGPYVPRQLKSFVVLGCWGDDGSRLVLLVDYGHGYNHCGMVLLDPATEDTKDVLVYSSLWPEGVFAYKDSLVSVGETSVVPVARGVRPRVYGAVGSPKVASPISVAGYFDSEDGPGYFDCEVGPSDFRF